LQKQLSNAGQVIDNQRGQLLQIEKDQTECNNLIQVFQNENSYREQIIHLRYLFLYHLSFSHVFQDEKKRDQILISVNT
jgi:hypothetical protein